MAKYSIEDTTLTSIGDSLRNYYGKTRIETIIGKTDYKVSKTPNATSFTTWEGGTPGTNIIDVVRIPNATSIKVNMAYKTNNTGATYTSIFITSGEYTIDDFPKTDDCRYYNCTEEILNKELVFKNTDVITFYYRAGSSNDVLGYYAEIRGYDTDGNLIKEVSEEEVEIEVEVPNTYNPLDMAGAIDNAISYLEEQLAAADPSQIPTDEELVIAGNCQYRFANSGWDWFVEKYGDRMTTKDISHVGNMFASSNLTNIPFEINCNKNSTYIDTTYMFSNCGNLLSIPKINNCKVSGMNSIFQGCSTIRHIPEDIDTWFDWSYMESQTSAYACNRGSTFHGCTSLRSFPMNFLNHGNPNASYSNSIYYMCFNDCNTLDEVIDLPFPHSAIWTSSAFNNTFNGCNRLKNVTFAVQKDGTPYTVKWKGQTISLNNYAGYLPSSNKYKITQYNSGITTDKEVIDDSTYTALKSDTDWWTMDIAYCRYNHDSAVNTINSLPDTSAYLASAGGTNTIKFTGAAGSKTDGGAINTLTEAEIAVAAAKGWTVTFV